MIENYEIVWEGEIIPTSEQVAKVRSELDYLCESLETAEDLMFHTVFMSKDLDGPSIFVYGKEGETSTFFAECHLETEWVRLDSEDENE
jgi:hypothetical protein